MLKHQIYVTDDDLQAMFKTLYDEIDGRRNKAKKCVCQWDGSSDGKFEDNEALLMHVISHIPSLADIAPINKLYKCQWDKCDKSFPKKKLIERHMREHTGDTSDQFLEILLKDQAKAISMPSKQMRWHPLVIKWCLQLYNKSHSAYNDLRDSKVLKLPSGRTLTDYKNFNHPMSGWKGDQIEAMQSEFHKISRESKCRIGMLLFDEVKIKEGLVFDTSTWELLGFTDLGQSDNLLFDDVSAEEDSFGFETLLVCCDGAAENRKFIKMNTGQFSGDNGGKLKSTRKLCKNGHWIVWKHVLDVFERDIARPCYTTPLRRDHVNVDALSKMKVKLAVDTLSDAVKMEMIQYGGDQTKETQIYIENCAKLWKVFNSQSRLENLDSTTFEELDSVLTYFNDWEDYLEKTYKTKQERTIHCISWENMFDVKVGIIWVFESNGLNTISFH
eukprot:gene2922-3375_t